MCSIDLPDLEIPTELQPYLLTELESGKYHLMVLPHLYGNFATYFDDYDLEQHAYHLGKLTSRFALGPSIIVLSEENRFFIDHECVIHEVDLPYKGVLSDIEHAEDPGSVREYLAENLKENLEEDRSHLDPWTIKERDYGSGVTLYDRAAVIKNSSLDGVPGLDLDSIARFCRIYGRRMETDGRLIKVVAGSFEDLLFLGRWLGEWGLQGVESPIDFALANWLPVWVNVRGVFFVDLTDPDPACREHTECLDPSLKVTRTAFREHEIALED